MVGVDDMADISAEVSDAVEWYWETLSDQEDDQKDSEQTARGRRAQVLGGAQMDGFAGLIEDELVERGLSRKEIHHDHDAVLPGYFRATKRWDIAVIHEDTLLAVIELKSIASSFGNNLNNRVEEAIGNNSDLRKAYEDGVFDQPYPPWIGYILLMADNNETNGSVRVRESNFMINNRFKDASYLDRAELLCSRMVKQGVVDAATLITSDEHSGLDGEYEEPNDDLTFQQFIDDITSHVETHLDSKQSKLDTLDAEDDD